MTTLSRNTQTDIQQFRKMGYTVNFRLLSQSLVCLENNTTYSADQLTIDKLKQKQLDKFTNNRRLIFALECKDGIKGILDIETKGSNGMKVLTFMDKVKVRITNEANAANK